MKRSRLLWLLALLAIAGCSADTPGTAPAKSDGSTTTSVGQSDDAMAAANTTLVSLKVPGMV